MRRKLVVGNWKMHGSQELLRTLLTGLQANAAQGDFADAAVCPPAVYLAEAATLLADSAISLGAQNLSQHEQGAYTGEVSGSMLAELGCRYVIVGHSERRELFAETDELVADKFIAAQRAGLTPILCVGESLAQREAGQTLDFVAQQLNAVIAKAGIEAFSGAVLAYEPIWAIGTGMTASPEQAQEVHQHLRQVVAQHSAAVAAELQMLYGGSVNAANAAQLFAQQDIDGALVGGASLKLDDFSVICRAAQSSI
ncbi:triose-phosphate isomerase [Dasania sp. GY-MA-18]|uniref:Triosephosphate isomerase n=1 Tax=Dasania phycosphaerae TaxID=2950436 RepID=A0A9J6RGU9_9GAMM|nr:MULTISPECIES: triose-phosphate isomerase [Dasania]MCR8921239.1 triose-phosphate isomerase [Dasania sp. GY-MA-18]MCZ0863667.1 triose-phosphate isomerase [Dasania phycosphaerae]MCZ0867395.1 triose-phosphate isomerase [Dasania phycosphaerae]